MSRRPLNPAAERAAKNQEIIKSVLKVEANKTCSDCKKNRHPRWASWNLGVFICIRCSGIHRGMGTHISRVKSVDLDSWTDEQLQSMLNWGNARANKYWESKLAQGHVPSESKIENFIRTKYELKRWVMDGPMPNPACLDAEGDDNIPLTTVKEKKDIVRRECLRKSSASRSIKVPEIDLIGADMPTSTNSTGSVVTKVPPKAQPAPPKATSSKDSLLGLDFLGPEPAAPPRPSSTTGTFAAGGQSRPDLKQSILSLYASAPRPQLQQTSLTSSGSLSGLSSPIGLSQTKTSPSGINDALSNLGLSNPSGTNTNSLHQDAFAGSSARLCTMSPPASNNTSAFSGMGGGSFFELKPAQQSKQLSNGGMGALASLSPAPAPMAPVLAAHGDLMDCPPTPAAASATASQRTPISSFLLSTATNNGTMKSVFNLSATQQHTKQQTNPTPIASIGDSLSGSDVWGGNAWATPDPAPAAPEKNTMTSNDFGSWQTAGGSRDGSIASRPIVPSASGGYAPVPAAKATVDEEFGGWARSSTPAAGAGGGGGLPASKSTGGGCGGSEDLFSNVWQ